jgi:hypothetical protein
MLIKTYVLMHKFVTTAILCGSLIYMAIYASARASCFGLSTPLLATAAVCFAAALAIGLFLFKSRPLIIKLIPLVVLVVATLVVEGFAGSQELAVVQKYGKACKKGTYVSRWVPFSNSVIYCGADGEWMGND